MLNKILLVIKREYLTRVRKKSFIIMTILAPLLVVLFYGLIFYFAINKDVGETQKLIYVADESGLFTNKLQNKTYMEFHYGPILTETAQKELLTGDAYYAILKIPPVTTDDTKGITLISKDQPGLTTINYIEQQLGEIIKNTKLRQYGIDQQLISKINQSNIKVNTVKITATGMESGSSGVSTVIGFIGAILIYMFIFLYGVQVMRGVIEEKTNRIVEVIISSLKPFELMMGKIIGIALVGLTQFIIWVVLIMLLSGTVSGIVLNSLHLPAEATAALHDPNVASDNDIGNILQAIGNFNFPLLIGCFLFFFIAGYLFYGSLFAAVGSAVDNETDTQQFMLPITLPLVFAFVLAQSAVTANPNGILAFWLSIIPFTSPVVMMVRIPFGVPAWEIVLSMLCMIAGFISTVWLAGRIYRIGILMYGKKPSYKEIGKWLFYKG